MVSKHSRRLTGLSTQSQRRRGADTESPLGAINVAHVEVGGGVTGFIFTVGIIYIFLVGVPSLWWFLVGAMVLGVFISIALQLFHGHRQPASVWRARY